MKAGIWAVLAVIAVILIATQHSSSKACEARGGVYARPWMSVVMKCYANKEV